MEKLIECVPNFSEGRDENLIRQITDAIKSVEGVSLLDVDPGATTNRTVVTFVGSPEAAIEAAGIGKHPGHRSRERLRLPLSKFPATISGINFWARLAHSIMRRPLVYLAGGMAALVLAAVPAFALRLTPGSADGVLRSLRCARSPSDSSTDA